MSENNLYWDPKEEAKRFRAWLATQGYPDSMAFKAVLVDAGFNMKGDKYKGLVDGDRVIEGRPNMPDYNLYGYIYACSGLFDPRRIPGLDYMHFGKPKWRERKLIGEQWEQWLASQSEEIQQAIAQRDQEVRITPQEYDVTSSEAVNLPDDTPIHTAYTRYYEELQAQMNQSEQSEPIQQQVPPQAPQYASQPANQYYYAPPQQQPYDPRYYQPQMFPQPQQPQVPQQSFASLVTNLSYSLINDIAQAIRANEAEMWKYWHARTQGSLDGFAQAIYQHNEQLSQQMILQLLQAMQQMQTEISHRLDELGTEKPIDLRPQRFDLGELIKRIIFQLDRNFNTSTELDFVEQWRPQLTQLREKLAEILTPPDVRARRRKLNSNLGQIFGDEEE